LDGGSYYSTSCVDGLRWVDTATKEGNLILAYIDPGAGSLVIQAIIAAAVSVPFFLRNTIRSTVQRLRGPRTPDVVSATPDRQDEAAAEPK
jgi:hypothetical protein